MNKKLGEKITVVAIAGVALFSLTAGTGASTLDSLKTGDLIPLSKVEQVNSQSTPAYQLVIEKLSGIAISAHETYKLEQQRLEEIRIAELKEQQRLAKIEQARILEEKRIASLQTAKIQFVSLVKQKNITTIDLTTPSGLSAAEIDRMLEGTNFAGLGHAFETAERKYKVNAYYLIAHAAWESGWGESRLAKNKNNLFGFGAYDKSAYQSAIHFSSKSECILTVAEYINKHYLNEDGDHYNGPTLKGMNIKYASDDAWANGIASVMKSLMKKSTIETL